MAAWRAFIPIWLFVAWAWAAPPVATGPDSAAVVGRVTYADSATAAANLQQPDKEFAHRTYIDSVNADLRERELEQRKTEANRQKCYWIATLVAGFIAVGFGFVLNAWRNWVSQGTAKMTHLDETFRTYLERFSDRKQSAGVRIGASIGLTNLSKNRDPLRLRKHYSLREDTVHLFVESLATETHPDVLAAIRDRLVEIGQPALQILVDKHREWFPLWGPGEAEPPRWMPLTKRDKAHTRDDHEIDLDRLSPHFRASRDAIARIIKQAKKPGHLALPWKRRSVREWFGRPWPKCSVWWSEYRALRPKRWLDGNGVHGLALYGADLSGAHLEQGDLRRAHLQDAVLLLAHLDHADLLSAHLNHTNLRRAHLDGADLSWAHLEHAYLMGARLEHANLQKCNLSGALYSDETSCMGTNWWDARTDEEPLTDEQRAWFEEHYPRGENEPEFLKYWKKTDWGGYERPEGA